ncbi:MAG: aquaporin, partial [Muribaculaceae bacterium]|nr:aquaporin [Muribaculaceae bacterium]
GLGIGICFGLVLVCLCYALGNISGCHVNPAVSFAMFLAGRMSGKDCIGYIIFQLLGATVGAGLLFWFINMAPGFNFGGTTPPDSYLATNVLQPGATSGMALLAEGLLTFFFVLIVLGATDPSKGFGKFAGLAIGLALGLVNIVGIPVDNCSVNPARSFGPAVFDPTAWGDFWIMVVGPAIGAVLAVLCWVAMAGGRKAIK